MSRRVRPYINSVRKFVKVTARRRFLKAIESSELFEAIQRGLRLRQRLERLKKELDEVRELIRKYAEQIEGDHTVLHMEAEGIVAKITYKDTLLIKEERIEDLEEVLRSEGYDPAELIEVKTEYKPTRVLLQVLERIGRKDFLKIRVHKPTVEFYEK